MHRHQRASPGQRQAVGQPAAHHQGAHEPRPRGVGHGIRPLDPRLGQHLANHRQQPADMVTGGDFRHNAAIHRMQIHLAVQRLRQQAPFGVVQRGAGLVAARFDSQDLHRRRMIPEDGRRTAGGANLPGFQALQRPGNADIMRGLAPAPVPGFFVVWTDRLE